MKNNPNCLFIMMGYNNPEITLDTLRTLRKFVAKEDVLLIDNGSKESLELVAKNADVVFVRHTTNLGFSEGYNVWLAKNVAKISQEYICLINNDVFVNAKMMELLPYRMRNWLLETRLAAIQPVLYLDKKLTRVENAGVKYYPTAMAFPNKNPKKTDSVLLNGACLFIKTKVVKEMFDVYGYLLNPIFFFNAEDVELSLRLKSRGFELLVDKELKAQHKQSSTVGKTSAFSYMLSVRNLLWTALITRSSFELLTTFPLLIIGQLLLFALSIKNKFGNSLRFSLSETKYCANDLIKFRKQFNNARKEFAQ